MNEYIVSVCSAFDNVVHLERIEAPDATTAVQQHSELNDFELVDMPDWDDSGKCAQFFFDMDINIGVLKL